MFSLVVGSKLRESSDVHLNAACIDLLALLNIVPSNNNQGAFIPNFAIFHVADNHLYHFCDNCTAFDNFVARFIHLAHLAASAHQRSIAAVAAAHIHQVATATATVIATSTKISPTILAFSSLRSQNQYHIMSLNVFALSHFAPPHSST
jgi:hypothetical protein